MQMNTTASFVTMVMSMNIDADQIAWKEECYQRHIKAKQILMLPKHLRIDVIERDENPELLKKEILRIRDSERVKQGSV